jgi:hypothetical protein
MINHSFPLLFPEAVPHFDVKVKHGEITSAGFVELFENGGKLYSRVYGHSNSLRLNSQPDDQIFISQLLGLKGE